MNNFIGVFDSGIGGLSILEKLKEVLPNENFYYYADKDNMPYGAKSEDELLKITSLIVDEFIRRNCKMIVIACNTATTKCMSKLKEKYKDMLFIGVVPAIKVACTNNYKNILLMATPVTINSKRTKELIENNKKANQNIYLLPCENLAQKVEKGNFKEINQILTKLLLPYQDKNIDAIVLGCTHYSLIKEEITKIMPTSELIDGTLGVAQEVKRKLTENNLLNKDNKGSIYFLDKLS